MADVLDIITLNPGSQEQILKCTTFEVLIHGPRATGKSITALVDYLVEVGKGWPRWRGLVTRARYGDLDDLILKSKELVPRVAPDARFTMNPYPLWQFPGGERLEFRQLRTVEDYEKIHGQEFDWWFPDELTMMPEPTPYLKTFSLIRGRNDGTPRRIRAGTNPSGSGHGWVKDRWQLDGWPRGQIVGPLIQDYDQDGEPMAPRRAIGGSILENVHLEKSYIQSLRSSCATEAQFKAWIYGDWDITEGGMFDDLWRASVHVVPDLRLEEIPQGWRLSRSYDWGSARPFSIGWTWTSDGEPIVKNGRIFGEVPGDRIRWREWYGHSGKLGTNKGLNMVDRDIAREVLRREKEWGVSHIVTPGPADSAIFQRANGTGVSIADTWGAEGVRWTPVEKGPNSRAQGWQQVREYLEGALPKEDGTPREFRGLFVCQSCRALIKFLPPASRDPKKPDDIDTESEEHVLDELRYCLFQRQRTVRSGTWRR